MKTTLVIPCFNEALRFDHQAFWREYEQLKGVHFIFVNDGSTDETATLFEHKAFAKTNITTLHLSTNQGKAEAVRQGMLWGLAHTDSSLFAYFDADFATPLLAIEQLSRPIIENTQCQLVLGSRLKRAGANIKRSELRHLIGRFFANLVSSYNLPFPVYDTQCGAKVMTRQLAQEVFKDIFYTRWLFDVEIIKRLAQSRTVQQLSLLIHEQPLDQWHEKGHSKVRFSDVLILPYSILKLNRVYR